MPRRKCSICEKWITKEEETVPYKGSLVHKECFDILMRQAIKEEKKSEYEKKKKKSESKKESAKPVIEIKQGLSEEEFKKKQDLFDLIRKYEGLPKLTAKTYKIVEDLMKKNHYSYEDVKKAIIWKHDIEQDPNVDWSDFAGLIVYFIDDALNWYKEQEEIQNQNEKIITENDSLYNLKVITKNVPKRNVKEIDLSTIGSG
jgi:hypothetical protein